MLYHWLSAGRDKLAVCQESEEGNWFLKRVNKIWQMNFCTFLHPLCSLTSWNINKWSWAKHVAQGEKKQAMSKYLIQSKHFLFFAVFLKQLIFRHKNSRNLKRKPSWFHTMPSSFPKLPTVQQNAIQSSFYHVRLAVSSGNELTASQIIDK